MKSCRRGAFHVTCSLHHILGALSGVFSDIQGCQRLRISASLAVRLRFPSRQALRFCIQHLVLCCKRRTKTAAHWVFPLSFHCLQHLQWPSKAHLVYKVNSPHAMKLSNISILWGFESKASTPQKAQWGTIIKPGLLALGSTFFLNLTITNASYKQIFSTVLWSPNLFKICHINYFPRFFLNINFWVWEKKWQKYCTHILSTNSLNVWKKIFVLEICM